MAMTGVGGGKPVVRIWLACLGLLGTLLVAVLSRPAPAPASAAPSTTPGYWLVASDGGLYNFGTPNYGSERGVKLGGAIVGTAVTPTGLGYWMTGSDGGVFSFGDAQYFGSEGGKWLAKPIVGMASTPSGHGYWLVASDGGIFSFGDAQFYGSMGGHPLNQLVVGMASTPSGHGYWLVASDGGIFSFGDAQFYGSMGGHPLNQTVVGMAADPDSGGYWLVASDGGIFSFNATFHGSEGGHKLNQPITGMASLSDGGYWMVARDGGIFSFGNATFLGSTGGHPGPAPIVAMAATPHGYPFPPGSTGYDVSKWQCNPPAGGGTCSLPPNSPIAIVEIAGATNSYQNPYYTQEAAWAGSSISSYIFMTPLPNPAPPESLPAGCGGNVNCEAYNFGYYWAAHWVSVSRSLGVYPNVWWIDVEPQHSGMPAWPSGTAGQAQNSQELAGAIEGLRASSVIPGIYSTNYQWNLITGSTLNYPGIALWVPGASNIYSGTYSAQNICNNAVPGSYGWEYSPFAGGKTVLVQYGYGSEYTGPPSPYDQDYAC